MSVHDGDSREDPFGKLHNRMTAVFSPYPAAAKHSVPAQIQSHGYAIACLVSLGVFAIALWSPAIFNDGDTFWHIRTGQWMLAHRAVLDHDVFSRTLSGKPWITEEWLSEVLMAIAWQSAGWSGVAILTGSAMAAATMSLGLFLGRKLDPLPCLVALVPGIACLMPDYLARPHILALPFLTIWVIGLSEASSSRRGPSWLLLPVMTVWANLHGSFVFGLALLVPMALDAVWDAEKDRARIGGRWAVFAAAATGAALVNPHGLSGLIYPFQLMQVQSLAAVGEWQPLDLRHFSIVEFSSLATAFFFVWRGIPVKPIRLLLLIALFHQSLVHARYGLILGITAPILLADSLGAAVNRERSTENSGFQYAAYAAALGAVMVLCGALRLLKPIERMEGPAAPAAAVGSIPASLAAKPVFNNYAFGGYLIFRGIKPLIDSRADFYGDARLADYWSVVSGNPAAVERIFRKYHVAWTLLAPGDPLVGVMDRRPGWHRLFSNSFGVVHAARRN